MSRAIRTEIQADSIAPSDGERYLLAAEFGDMGKLGSGGFATVHAYTDTRTSRHVAIKALRVDDNKIPLEEKRARFANEKKILALLSPHPNIVSMYDVQHDKIIMELLTGPTIMQHVVQHGAMEPRDALKVAVDLLGVLEMIHKKQIVHRDLSPNNIILHRPFGWVPQRQLDPSTFVKLCDFGVSASPGAAVTGTNTFDFKSGCFGAPERNPGVPGDLYQLGVLIIFMFSGTVPKQDGPCPWAWSEVLRKVHGLPEHLREELQRAINEDEGKRHQSASELLAVLRGTEASVLRGVWRKHLSYLVVGVIVWVVAKTEATSSAIPEPASPSAAVVQEPTPPVSVTPPAVRKTPHATVADTRDGNDSPPVGDDDPNPASSTLTLPPAESTPAQPVTPPTTPPVTPPTTPDEVTTTAGNRVDAEDSLTGDWVGWESVPLGTGAPPLPVVRHVCPSLSDVRKILALSIDNCMKTQGNTSIDERSMLNYTYIAVSCDDSRGVRINGDKENGFPGCVLRSGRDKLKLGTTSDASRNIIPLKRKKLSAAEWRKLP